MSILMCNTSFIRSTGLVTALAISLVAGPAVGLNRATVEQDFSFARQQLEATASQLPETEFPENTRSDDGSWQTRKNTDLSAWVQGFFPGELWLMYGRTGDAKWRTHADRWTRALEVQKTNTLTHDLGFKFFLSFGHAYQLTGDPYYRDVLLTAASSLASRYSSEVGAISCCDWNYPEWQLPVVVDTMMNLELLLWAAANGGQDDWRNMAIHHADRTAADIVRADGSTYHFADYDPVSGALLNRGTFQGYSDDSTWARGQAWAMYGYTMVYRYTHARRFLTLAQRTTDWYLSHLPDDGVPNWDFDAPILVKDSSAAAIAASAMLELSGYVKDSTVAKRYRAAAVRTLEILSSSAYLAKGTTSQSILLHGVRFLPAGKGIDVGLVYGDYYFLEALTRFDRRRFPWTARFSFPVSIHQIGASNTGLQLVEFDVTPLAAPIDGVIGYTDSSTTVNAYSSLALAVRMNASGQFDVRNGASYEALTDVPYHANKTYYVRILADLDHRRYSVWVTPPGQTEVQIARDFAFRNNAPPTDDLGQVSLKAGHRDDEFILDSHWIRPATGYVR